MRVTRTPKRCLHRGQRQSEVIVLFFGNTYFLRLKLPNDRYLRLRPPMNASHRHLEVLLIFWLLVWSTSAGKSFPRSQRLSPSGAERASETHPTQGSEGKNSRLSVFSLSSSLACSLPRSLERFYRKKRWLYSSPLSSQTLGPEKEAIGGNGSEFPHFQVRADYGRGHNSGLLISFERCIALQFGTKEHT